MSIGQTESGKLAGAAVPLMAELKACKPFLPKRGRFAAGNLQHASSRLHDGALVACVLVCISSMTGSAGCIRRREREGWRLVHARQAIELHLEGMLEDGELLPEMLPVEAFQRRREYRGGIWFMVEINPSRLMSGARRVNITLPERLLTQIDRAAAAENTSRSGFIAEAALARIAGARSERPAGRKIARAGRKG